jgi:hypothetical protein
MTYDLRSNFAQRGDGALSCVRDAVLVASAVHGGNGVLSRVRDQRLCSGDALTCAGPETVQW